MGDYTNVTSATQQLQLRLNVRIKTTFHDGTPVLGFPVQSEFSNSADLRWDDANTGGTQHNASGSASDVSATEPYLVLAMDNDTGGVPVAGGQPVNYTITVDNVGTSAAHQGVLVVTMPEAMRTNTPSVASLTLDGSFLTEGLNYTVSWNPATGELTIDLTAGSAGPTIVPEGGQLVAVVTASASEDVGAGADLRSLASIGYNSWTDSSGRATPLTSDPLDPNTDVSDISIQSATAGKTHDAAGLKATIGSVFAYTVTVTVPARTTIYGATGTDTVPDGLTVTSVSTAVGTAAAEENPDGTTSVTWSAGDYTNATDEPADITLTVNVRVDKTYTSGTDVSRGDSFDNTVSFSWNDAASGGHSHIAIGPAPAVTVAEPDVSVTKEVDDAAPAAGDTITYTIGVENTGDWPAHNIIVNDSVDSHLTYVPGSITGPGASAEGNDLSWDLEAGIPGPLNPGATLSLTYQATVNGGAAQGLVVPNTAVVPAYYSLPQPDGFARQYAQESASRDVTCRAAALSAAKTVVAGGNPDWGEEVTYRIVVENTGDATASHVGVADTIPSPHFSYVTGSTSASWTGGSSSADPTGTPPAFNWNLDAELASGDSLTLEFRMRVDQWAAYGTKTNSGTGFGKDGGGADLPESTDTADIDVKQHPGISVAKALDSPGRYVPVDTDFSYTITVTNEGNTTVPAVPVTDTYNSAYLQYVSATVAPDPDPPVAGSVVWPDISGGAGITPGNSASVTVTFKTLQPGAAPQTDNAAEVDTADDQSNPVTADDTNSELVITNPGVTVTKTLSGNGFVPVGGTATYTIRVANNGDTAVAAPVRLTDTYNASYLQYVSASPTPNASAAGNLTWTDISGGAGIPVSGAVEVTVNMKALKVGSTPQTDDTASVVANDEHGVPVPGQGTNKDLKITGPGLTVSKAVKAGQQNPVGIGSDVTFVITVTNKGTTAVAAPVPMTDNFNPSYMRFVSSPYKPESVTGGKVSWPDVSGGKGLAVGARKDVEVTFKAIKQGGPPNTTDTAIVSGAKDAHGAAIPEARGSASVTTGKVVGFEHWFIAEGSTGGGFDTWILLQNPGAEKANVNLTFATAEGPKPPLPVTIDPMTRTTVRIQDHVPDNFEVSTFVDSDRPVVAERSMYWDKRFWGASDVPGNPQPYEMKGGHSNLGVAVQDGETPVGGIGKTIYFPEGSTAPGFDTWILIANPGSEDATVAVNLHTPEGEKKAGSVTVRARSRQTVHINELLPGVPEVSTELVADRQVVAERSMYWDPNASSLEPYQMKGGHASSGSAVKYSEWFNAEGSTAQGFETFISVQNPNSTKAGVTVTFMNANGIVADKAVTMEPKTRLTFKAGDFAPDDWHVSTRITSDNPVVAERAMYWDKRVTSDVSRMLEGHSTTAVTRAGTKWTVPEGSTGGGFDTWILIANPTANKTSAVVTFMTASGPREPFTVELAPNSRYTLRIADFIPEDFHVSTLVETGGQIVVERAMYWDKRVRAGLQPYEMMGGHSTTGLDP